MTIQVEHVVPYIGNESSGPAWAIPKMCSALVENRANVRLHVLGPLPNQDFNFQTQAYPWHWFPHSRLGRSPEMKQGLKKAAATADVLHNHSLWMMPNIYPGAAVKGKKCRLVVSPHGTLTTWAIRRSQWLKRIIMCLGQRRVLEDATCLHATAVTEYEDIRRIGLRAPIAILPIGVDVPPAHCEHAKGSKNFRRLLFLSRFTLKKGSTTFSWLGKLWKKYIQTGNFEL